LARAQATINVDLLWAVLLIVVGTMALGATQEGESDTRAGQMDR
jgi:hypothetical protein